MEKVVTCDNDKNYGKLNSITFQTIIKLCSFSTDMTCQWGISGRGGGSMAVMIFLSKSYRTMPKQILTRMGWGSKFLQNLQG
jgi:hypothetical protein